MSLVSRVVLTLLLIVGWGVVNTIYAPVATLAVGQAVGGQFQPSDSAYLQTMYNVSAWGLGNRLLSLLFLLAIAALWAGPVVDVTSHVRLPNSGIFANKYVSPGRLIKVDRSPAAREWVKASHRGTGSKDESFPCQSSEGIDITVGVSMGASVKEENAPKFLYTFGVNPPKVPQGMNPEDPTIVFTSVYYGKSLNQVMDEKVRPRVQSLVCAEMTTRNLDTANKEADKIMSSIQGKVKDYCDSVGITLDFIGWADTFEFQEAIQKAINDRYIVDKLGPSLNTLAAIANLKVQEGLGAGLDKHGLPVVVTPDMLNILSGLAAKAPVPSASSPVNSPK